MQFAAQATPSVPFSGLNAADQNPSPAGGGNYWLNTIVPSRMMIAANGLYESTDQGRTVTDITSTLPGYPPGGVGSITAGGFSGGARNADVAYIAFPGTNALFLRTSAGGPFTQLTSYPGSAPSQVVLDPDDWRIAYVLDAPQPSRVFRTTNAGAPGSWTELTGNLNSFLLSPDYFRTIECVKVGATPVLLVGGQGGVYRLLNPGTGTAWSEFGTGLPNAEVSDMHYYPLAVTVVPGVPFPEVRVTGDVLIVGTYGRGTWTISNASATLATLSSLTINGAAYEFMGLHRDPNIRALLNVFENGVRTFTVEGAALQQITVNALVGREEVNIDDTFTGVPVTVNLGAAKRTPSTSARLSGISAPSRARWSSTGGVARTT